jgi:hypothetical protein
MGASPSTSESRSDARIVWFAVALVAAALWIRPLFSSLWLDELLTHWVVGGSLGQAMARSSQYQGQSVAYNAVAWLIARLSGRSEFFLRLPSLTAMVVAGFVFYRLVSRLIDEEAARFATLAFVASQGIAFTASDFRPYPFALLAVVLSFYTSVRWLDDGGTRWGVGYAISVAAVVWTQYLFVLVLPAQGVYWLARARAGSSKVKSREVAWAVSVALCLVAPAVVEVAELWSRRAQLTIPASPDLETLLAFFVPPVVGGALLVGVLATLPRSPVGFRPVPARVGTVALLAGWLVIPPTVLFSLAAVTDLSLLSSRYYISAAPAGAALFGWGVRCLEPSGTRRLIALLLAIFSVVAFGGPTKLGQDWRGAIAYADSLSGRGTLVLLRSGPIESEDPSWLVDPARRGYLLAPAGFYPIVGRARVVPYGVDPQVQPYLDSLLKQVNETDHFLLIAESATWPLDATPWFEARLASDGWTLERSASFGEIEVSEFVRAP